MIIAIYTGHAPVRGHLHTMGQFDGYPVCRFCGMETETVQLIICCCEALAGQRYSVFGRLTVEPKDISTASVRDLCLFVRGEGLLRLYNKPTPAVHSERKLTGPNNNNNNNNGGWARC